MPNWRSFEAEAYRLTEKEIDKLIPYILAQYEEAIKAINKDLQKVYSNILSGIPPEDYYNEMLKYDRLTKLQETITKQYVKYSREAGKTVGQTGMIASSNNYYRLQYSYSWLVPGIDFSILPNDIVQMSVFSSTEAWKRYTGSINEKIFGSAGLYFPQSGTLSNFLATNRLKELENIQRAVTQGLLQGHSSTKTSRAVRDVIGRQMIKDGAKHVSGAMANATRIVRTESIRIMNQAGTANTEQAREQGVIVVRIWDATLDNVTRPVHAHLDDKEEDKNGYFHSQVGLVRGPGQFPTVGQNVNDRCTTYESINGSKPTLRRGRNPVTGKNEVFEYKDFARWAKDNNLTKNKFGQIISTKK